MFVLTIAVIFVHRLLESQASVPCYTQCTRLVHYGCAVCSWSLSDDFLGRAAAAFRALDPVASYLLEPGCCSHNLFSAFIKLPPSSLPVPPHPHPHPHSNIKSHAHCASLLTVRPHGAPLPFQCWPRVPDNAPLSGKRIAVIFQV